MGMIQSARRTYLQKTGKIKEAWPIVIRIYREAGEGNYVLSKVTRGRSLRDEDNRDTVKLEVMDAPLETVEVPYKYFTNRRDGVDELEIVRHTRTSFSPLQKKIKCKGPDDEEAALDKIYDIEQMKKTAISDFEQKSKVVENDDEPWFENKYVQVFILFLGAGIFFVLLGIGYSRVVSQPVLDAVNELQASQNMVPVLGLMGGQKIKSLKESLFGGR